MAIVFAGLVPHSPLLALNIGKEHRIQLSKTVEAYQWLVQDLKESKPEVLVIISSHAASGIDWWNANVCLDYEVDLSAFGDLLTKGKWPGALGLAEELQNFFGQETGIRFYSQPYLDYGTTIPLLLLDEALKDVKILPIGYLENKPREQAQFGQKLGQFLKRWPGKAAIIGSGDLAHCLGAEQPNGLQARGKKFDQRLQEALRNNDEEAMLNISSTVAAETGQCAWLAYITLLAAMKDQPGSWQNLAYEAPFGVGGAVWRWQKDVDN